MNLVNPVVFQTPDGVERNLRATMGARKRIADRFKQPDLGKIMEQYGDGALAEVAWCMMFDSKGKPPEVSAEELAESLSWDDNVRLLASVMSAFGQGKTSPNDMEAQLRGLPELLKQMETSTGLISTDSASSASDSQTNNSGTDSSNAKLTLVEEPTDKPSAETPSS